MRFIQDILIVIARFLIFIGDIVLLLLSLILNAFKPLINSIKTSNDRLLAYKNSGKEVVETEIFNAENESSEVDQPQQTTGLIQTETIKSSPRFNLPNFTLPSISIPKLTFPKFNISIPEPPELYFPEIKIPDIKLPKYSFPKISLPKPKLPPIQPPMISTPEISVPRVNTPSFSKLRISFPEPYYPAFIGLPHFGIHRHKRRGRKRISLIRVSFGTKFKYLFVGAIVSFIFFFLPLFAYTFIKSLPDPHSLAYQEIPQTTKIYDRNKVLLYQIYANQNRTDVPLSKIPDHFKKATIAIEDQNFYTTPGFDPIAIARSARADLSGQPLQGGSTITQQLIKTRLLTPERSFERKIKEVILAVWAEQIYTKDQILEMYFNQVPYGGTAWGAEAAAQTYFGKSVEDLDLAESSFLAGLPQAPSIYSPYSGNEDLWKKRQKDVLVRMIEDKFITQEEAKKAQAKKLIFRPNQNSIKAPHFVMYVKDLLIQKYGLPVVERGGLTVITSLDIKTQDLAQKIITDEVENAGYLGFTNAASLVTNPKNGDIIAMVGGKDYFDENGGNYNVTTALRQPGSTIKVVTYTAGLMDGMTAASTIQDNPVSFASHGSPPYSPVNYDGKFRGSITLRNALGNSINIPAVKTLNQVGIPNMVSLAKEMGISSWGEPDEYGLAITLGAAETKMTEMATVYGTLANNGKRVYLNPILKVTTYQGAVLEEKTDSREKKVLPSEIAFIISNILADNNARAMEFGMNSPLNIPKHTVSVKTGTTDNKRDNWTIGYTPTLLTAVWVGNNDNKPMNPVLASGITGAAPIWNKIMSSVLATKNISEESYPQPENIVARPCGGKTEYFVKGTESPGACRPISINDKQPNR